MCGSGVRDWYDHSYYQNSPVDDPTGPATGSDRVYRGGGWDYPASGCRSAYRRRDRPGYRNSYLGFRVAAVPSASPSHQSSERSRERQPVGPQGGASARAVLERPPKHFQDELAW